MGQEVPAFHQLSIAETCQLLGCTPASGLSDEDVRARIARDGANTLPAQGARHPLRILMAQFADVMVVALIVAAAIAAWVGEPQDSIVIGIIIALDAILGFTQEFRAEKAVAALKQMTATVAMVRRNGMRLSVPSAELVAGDVVFLEAGNIVPADIRLIEAADLQMGEAVLTGESVPVAKSPQVLHAGMPPLGDRTNMAFKGTIVTKGRGLGLVVGTGSRSELGKIAHLLKTGEEVRTPLQARLARLGMGLAGSALGICALLFVVGVVRGEDPLTMFMTTLSLAVAAIPEALPAVVTMALAMGARRMVKLHALVRRLPAVETLGSVTYICTDKTGTLTENRMQVESFDLGQGPVKGEETSREGLPENLWLALALSNDAQWSADGKVTGDPTEIAFLECAHRAGFEREKLEANLPRIGEIAFTSERGRMSTIHKKGDGALLFAKGAPERLLELCARSAHPKASQDTSLDWKADVLTAGEKMAASGLRVLAFAQREMKTQPTGKYSEAEEADLDFLGLVGLLDPPRQGCREAVGQCQAAGIQVVMITGDHPATAKAIAERLGIAEANSNAVMTGAELAALSDEDFEKVVLRIRVYARVSPEQKIQIVRVLQAQGQYVAMTGDGVNDAPALQKANIGIAMGKAGTDVAREASHMILTDDNFITIVGAVREGRRVYDNIRKFIRYALTGNVGEIFALALAPLFGMPLPLAPIQILWVNLVTDGLPGLALVSEPEERNIMSRPPRPPSESIFARGLWQQVVLGSILIGGICLALEWFGIQTGRANWQTMVFTTLALSQLFGLLAMRSEQDSFFSRALFANRPLLAAIGVSVALQLATIYNPFLSKLFRTQRLSVEELGLCVGCSMVLFFAIELRKLVSRRWSTDRVANQGAFTWPTER